MIPTNIGVFVIKFDINYTVGIKAVMDLYQFRNVDTEVVFISKF